MIKQMKKPSIQILKDRWSQVSGDRPLIVLAIGLIIAGIIYSIVVGIGVYTSDVTVYTRYTAFGEAHFYRSPWQYLLLFVAFAMVVVAAHIVLMLKFYSIDRRQSALFIGWLGIVILIIAMVYSMSVVGLGRAV